MMKYAVGHNMPGYLAESDPMEFETLEQARSALLGELEYAADHHADVCEELGKGTCTECTELEQAWEAVAEGGALEVHVDKYVYWVYRFPVERQQQTTDRIL